MLWYSLALIWYSHKSSPLRENFLTLSIDFLILMKKKQKKSIIKAQDKKAKTYPTPNCTFPTPKGAKWEEVRITFHSDKAFFHSMSIFLLQVNACLHIMTSVQNLIYQSIEEFSHFSFPAHFLNHCPCHEQGLLPTSSGAHCVVPCPLSLF